jgi:hypothetical protein
LDVRTDDEGNQYIELERSQDTKTRVTYLPYRDWAGQAAIRIQIMMADGTPQYGIEISVDRLGEFVSSIIELLNIQAQKKT